MKMIQCNVNTINSNNINESYFFTLLQIIEDEYKASLSIIKEEIIKKDEIIDELKNEIMKYMNKNNNNFKPIKPIKEYDNFHKINELKNIINSLTEELVKKDKTIEKLTFASIIERSLSL